jgi:arsenical pump membrane protein
MQLHANAAIYTISVIATGGVIIRPWRFPEAIWAMLGAAALVVFGLISRADAVTGILKGLDVYYFLAGMMLLAELARREGLFDWLAALAAEYANGSAQRLFTLIYLVAIVVTTLLSNDATAVVLTPAVYAAARAAGAKPLPLLLICAFVANAASFVLPISNPANLVVFGAHMPNLADWLRQFFLPSALAIAATYAALWLTHRRLLRTETLAAPPTRPALSNGVRHFVYRRGFARVFSVGFAIGFADTDCRLRDSLHRLGGVPAQSPDHRAWNFLGSVTARRRAVRAG